MIWPHGQWPGFGLVWISIPTPWAVARPHRPMWKNWGKLKVSWVPYSELGEITGKTRVLPCGNYSHIFGILHVKCCKGKHQGPFIVLGVFCPSSKGNSWYMDARSNNLHPNLFLWSGQFSSETWPLPYCLMETTFSSDRLWYSICREKLAYETEFKLGLKLSWNSA